MSTLDQNAHKVENEHLLMWHKTKCKFLAKIPFLKAITTAVLYEEMKQVKTTYVYISHIVVEFLVSKLFYSRLIYCLGVVLLQHHLFYMKVIFCQKFYSVHIVYLFCNFFFSSELDNMLGDTLYDIKGKSKIRLEFNIVL